MLALQQKDGSFEGFSDTDILEHTAEISWAPRDVLI